MCTSTCPAARHSDYNPREIIERVLEGDISILEDDNIWNCFYCYTCHSVCPVGNSVCEVNQILKQFAIKNGIGYDKLYEYLGFADSYFTAAIGAIPEIFFTDIDRDVSRIIFAEPDAGDAAIITDYCSSIQSSNESALQYIKEHCFCHGFQ